MWDKILTALENFAGLVYNFIFEPEEVLGFEGQREWSIKEADHV